MQVATQRNDARQIRQRSRLACDNCAKSRVKCHGNLPCRRCEENGYQCHYDRDIQKRGRKRKHQVTSGVSPGNAINVQIERSQELRSPQETEETHNLILDLIEQNSPAEFALGHNFAETAAAAPPFRSHPSPILPSPCQVDCENGLQEGTHAATRSGIEGQLLSNNSIHTVSRPNDPPVQYTCLAPLLPYLKGVMKPQLACELLELYFAPAEGSLFHNASPYVLTPVLRKESVLGAACTRPTTPALLATMMWVSAQTASLPQLLAPGSRERLCAELQDLVLRLQHDRDPDNWQRVSGRLARKSTFITARAANGKDQTMPCPVIDDVLSLILITVVLSGGDYKRDCLPWWSKALRLIDTMKLHQIDYPESHNDDDSNCDCGETLEDNQRPRPQEAKEEMRRTYWLAFALDRHLALSYNGNLAMGDGESYVYSPVPEHLWQAFDENNLQAMPIREQGPPTSVTGTGFFEFFLPLMVLLGDIIHLRRRRSHPRLGSLDGDRSIAVVEDLLDRCSESIYKLQQQSTFDTSAHAADADLTCTYGMFAVLQGTTPDSSTTSTSAFDNHNHSSDRRTTRTLLVTAYARFILHVLHILLHGEWDALTMLAWLPLASSQSEWMTSPSFHKSSSHAVFASEAISAILAIDPELVFMPYLFGIYLFHGSLMLLLFADRMPAVHGGPNEAVEAACETVIRAHEACIVTLNTEFQCVFKRVMRATLMVVKNQNKTGWQHDASREDEHPGIDSNADIVRDRIIDMRKEMLRLYRWSRGGRGLAI